MPLANAKDIYGLLEFLADKLLYPALLIALTHWVSKRSQANQWLRDRKLQEYSELLEILLERKEDILLRKSGPPIQAVDPREQVEQTNKYLAVGKAFQNRLFIDRALRRIHALERWNEIERKASDQTSSYVDCQTKLNNLIDDIRKSAQESVGKPEGAIPYSCYPSRSFVI